MVKLYKRAHPRTVVCDQGGCKAVFTFWHSDIAEEEHNMGGDGSHCKHFQEIGKFQISPFCPHLIQECYQGLVVGAECTMLVVSHFYTIHFSMFLGGDEE
jgi:hypothetical protein